MAGSVFLSLYSARAYEEVPPDAELEPEESSSCSPIHPLSDWGDPIVSGAEIPEANGEYSYQREKHIIVEEGSESDSSWWRKGDWIILPRGINDTQHIMIKSQLNVKWEMYQV